MRGMVKRNSFLRLVKNSRGMLTAEFIFSLVLVAGLCIVLFALNFTLSMTEVTQYIVFSASRAHAAAHKSVTEQQQMGKDKYNALINNAILKNLLNNPDGGWFQLSSFEVRSGGDGGNTFNDEYGLAGAPTNGDSYIPYTGARVSFQPKLLNVKIAFLGSTAEDPGAGFTPAKITAFLVREPTQKECWDQVLKRYDAILNLDPRYKILGSSGANGYRNKEIEDNGC